ncbi:MAG: tetratricopeptide repeat protein [Maioricimonas sp. JB045]
MYDKKKRIAECYRRGSEAMQKQNWGYAIEMFGLCTTLEPENVAFRQLLRNSTYKKYNDNKSGAGTFAKSKLLSIRGRIRKAKAKEEWDEVDKAAEEGLAINPWDAGINAELGHAARARGYLDIARFAYNCARQSDPKTREYSVALAEVLAEKGDYAEAGKVWQNLVRINPEDSEARSNVMRMQALETTDHGGYEGAESTQDVMATMNKRLKVQSGGEADGPGMSKEMDLQRAIKKEPEKVEHYLKLGEHYRQQKELDKAYETFEQAVEVSGNDPNVREQLEDIELARLKHNIDLAREASNASPDDATAKENYDGLRKELVKREIEVFSRRIQRHPQDVNIKYELALRLMKIRKWTQAVPLLQQAAQNNRLKGKALLNLGKCFIQDKKLTLARGQLERAVVELSYDADPKMFTECHYLLARVAEELGDTATAENHYGEVLVVKYDYKDARERLESLQEGDDEAAAAS